MERYTFYRAINFSTEGGDEQSQCYAVAERR
jgi:hypothetical protein